MDRTVERGLWTRGRVLGALVLVALGILMLILLPTVRRWAAAESSIERTRVRTAIVERGALVRDVSVQGKVIAAFSPTLVSPARGTVRVVVRPGAEVSPGQALIVVDSPELSSLHEQEQSTTRALEADLERQRNFTYTNGRMTKVSGFVDFIGYHSNGMIAHVSHANGMTYRTDIASSAMRRPSNIRLDVPGIGELAFGTHTYDGAGNLITRGPEYFLYDRLSRITRFQRGDGTRQTYGYDAFGNLGTITTFAGTNNETRSFAINRSKNRLSSVPYDARGNMLQWTDQSYRYDDVDMLLQKNFPWETYIYTADDERVLTMRYRVQTETLSEVYTLRNLDGKVLRRYTADGGSKGTWSWGKGYIYDSRGWTLLEISPNPAPLRNKHYAHDHLGTPVVVTNQNGAIIGTDSLWAYGEPVDPTESFNLQRFTGHERDYSPDGRAFDLDYMHARHAVTYMGRFMSVDPARRSQNPRMPQSWNRYVYGLNSPMKYVDPDGNSAVIAYQPADLARNQAFRDKVRERVSSIPFIGERASGAVDFGLSMIIPGTQEELQAMFESGLPMAAGSSIGRAGFGLVRNTGLTNASKKAARALGASEQKAVERLIGLLQQGSFGAGTGTRSLKGKLALQELEWASDCG